MVMLEVFEDGLFLCSSGPCGGMPAALFPPLSVTRRGNQRNKPSIPDREERGDTGTDKEGREGNVVARRKGVPVIKDFG